MDVLGLDVNTSLVRSSWKNIDWANPIVQRRIDTSIAIFNDAIEKEPSLGKFYDKGIVLSRETVSDSFGTIAKVFHTLIEAMSIKDTQGQEIDEAKVLGQMYKNAYRILEKPDAGWVADANPTPIDMNGILDYVSDLRARVFEKAYGNSAPAGTQGLGPISGRPMNASGMGHGKSPVAKQPENQLLMPPAKQGNIQKLEHEHERNEEEIREAFDEMASAREVVRDAQFSDINDREGEITREIKAAKAEPRRGDYAKDSLKAAAQLLSNEYFELVIMLLGFVFGIYLSFVYNLWIIGIPIIVGAALIGTRPDASGKSLWGKFFDSVVKPAGDITMGAVPMSIIIFIIGVVLVSSVTAYLFIEVDALQFATLAMANSVLLIWLWLGKAPSSPWSPPERGSLVVKDTGTIVPVKQKQAPPEKEETALATRSADIVQVSKGELEEIIDKKLGQLKTRDEPAALTVRDNGALIKQEQKAWSVIKNQEKQLAQTAKDEKKLAKEIESEESEK